MLEPRIHIFFSDFCALPQGAGVHLEPRISFPLRCLLAQTVRILCLALAHAFVSVHTAMHIYATLTTMPPILQYHWYALTHSTVLRCLDERTACLSKYSSDVCAFS